jgi:hypothetical protein
MDCPLSRKERVDLTDLPEPPYYPEELFDTLRRRYEECQKAAAKENQTAVIWCYTPNDGEVISVNDVAWYTVLIRCLFKVKTKRAILVRS